jgi:hypothetical protein
MATANANCQPECTAKKVQQTFQFAAVFGNEPLMGTTANWKVCCTGS